MFLVGLSGGIASGKSSVIQVFRDLGCAVIDADDIAHQGYRYVILDIPLLFETKTMLRFMKHTVVVYCDPQTQLSRLMERNGLSQEEAEARIAAQLPLEEKRQLAQHILDNSGEWEVTRRQTLRLHSQLEDSLDFLPLRLGLFAGFVGIIYLFSRHFLL